MAWVNRIIAPGNTRIQFGNGYPLGPGLAGTTPTTARIRWQLVLFTPCAWQAAFGRPVRFIHLQPGRP